MRTPTLDDESPSAGQKSFLINVTGLEAGNTPPAHSSHLPYQFEVLYFWKPSV
jgi:hypothetical protein